MRIAFIGTLMLLLAFFVPMLQAMERGEFAIGIYGAGGLSFGNPDIVSGSRAGVMLGGDPALWKNGSSRVSTAWGVGAEGDICFIKNVSLGVGLYFDCRRVLVEYPANSAAGDLELDFRLMYFKVPAGVNYHLGWFFAGGGFYYGLVVFDRLELRYATTGAAVKKEHDIGTKNDRGYMVNAGADIPLMRNSRISCIVRYEGGLRDIYTGNGPVSRLKNSALIVNVGCRFYFR